MRSTLLALVVLLALGATPAAASDDPLWQYQWGPEQVRAPQAWPTSTGAGAVIAVVDSGVDLDHPDLAAKLLPGATFLECPDGGSCGDGDWESGPQERRESSDGHGTHVAGIAAAVTGNGTGIAGVAPDAQIIPVKALDAEGGSFGDIAAGIRWSVDQGADVVNLSLGALPGTQVFTLLGDESEVAAAIAYARERGALVVAAAGNEFIAPLCDEPAFDRGALCVVATDSRELRAAYSNFALNQDMDAVAAPGGSSVPACEEDIVSSVPVGTGAHESCGYGTDYEEIAGTSMSAPHVSGVGALLMAQGRSDDDALRILEETARDPDSETRGTFDPVYGYGIVDAAAAVGAPGASGGDGSATPAGTSDGGGTAQTAETTGTTSGSTTSGGTTAQPAPLPAVERLRMRGRRKVAFRVNVAGRLKLVARRRVWRGGERRWRRVARFRGPVAAGTGRVRLSRKLRRDGRYRLRAVLVDHAGQRSAPRVARFRLR